ncbi:sister chromatid cohesion 1 protein 1 [Quillaja saponaria]|uniref:Sister chromatid cohesion 1 protein 1 n=1 Tax=Quillaja saponaria TaxID=32244 RepID=A0AAD7LK22_QUISA|nr:sister chromatid cohesion 1 protein 1 [Quillaja saponaria]
MFYSHQLLARKAPLGQIWYSFRTHFWFRSSFFFFFFIEIMEYQSAISIYDVTRLLVLSSTSEFSLSLLHWFESFPSYYQIEINEAWKVKAVPDPTLLPKGKTHAKFDIEGDEETHPNCTFGENTHVPTRIVSSPPLDFYPRAEIIQDQHPDRLVNQQSEECIKVGQRMNIISTLKIPNLMELPPVVLIGDLFTSDKKEIYYPPALLELWMKSTQLHLDSPSGDNVDSLPSSASEHGFVLRNSEVDSGRSNRKRRSSSKNSSAGLETVAEEQWQHSDPNFKLTRLSENGLTPDQELLVETGPTQTQPIFTYHPVDKMTESIRVQMKAHFDTPGAPEVVSLDLLSSGMTRKAAALLFYQTCVLASRDDLRVEQRVSYGEILISKGAKM